MRGFGSRERIGLIVFLCLVAVLIALGPIADRTGCTRRYDEPQALTAPETSGVPDSAKDSIRPAGSAKRSVRRDSIGSAKREGKKAKKGSRKQKVSPAPKRRDYLDEPI